jgi:hypothetical protein
MKQRNIFLGIAGLALNLATSTNAIIVEWKVADGGNGHFYEPVPQSEGLGLYDAILAADAKGGHLVHINSAAENAFVFARIASPEYWISRGPYFDGPWLGAHQFGSANDEPAGGFKWVDLTGAVADFTFTNWRDGQPDDFNPTPGQINYNNENAVMFWNIGSEYSPLWNDVPDSIVSSSYIIEYEVNANPPPTPTVPDAGSSGALLGLALGSIAFVRRTQK